MKQDLKSFEADLETYRHEIWTRNDKRNLDLRLPKSQFKMPRIHINTSDAGETTLLLDYGLPCCGLSIVLECPETFDIAFMREFIAKASEMREWLKDNYFSTCAVATPKPE
jgi:hypothetical protein